MAKTLLSNSLSKTRRKTRSTPIPNEQRPGYRNGYEDCLDDVISVIEGKLPCHVPSLWNRGNVRRIIKNSDVPQKSGFAEGMDKYLLVIPLDEQTAKYLQEIKEVSPTYLDVIEKTVFDKGYLAEVGTVIKTLAPATRNWALALMEKRKAREAAEKAAADQKPA